MGVYESHFAMIDQTMIETAHEDGIMKIAASNLQMQASSSYLQTRQTQEKLNVWIDPQKMPTATGNSANSANSTNSAAKVSPPVDLSDAGKIAQSQESEALDRLNQIDEDLKNDPRWQLIQYMVELFTGKKMATFNAQDLNTDTTPNIAATSATTTPAQANTPTNSDRQGWGVLYSQHTSYTEHQTTQFHASGSILTADQKQIQFDMSFSLERSLRIESDTQIRLGDAKKIDPLLLNFSGQSAQLTSQKFAFDLNADGTKESISFVKGAGFLVFDKNADGKVNDGKELFGPATGNGFSELAQYDSDGNHWIDENDAIYQKLSVWTKDAGGKDVLQNLKQANVGALFLGNVSTPFDLNNANGKTDGQLKSSGVWLSEDGQAHHLQQVDLMV
jgi:hypothetical protein